MKLLDNVYGLLTLFMWGVVSVVAGIALASSVGWQGRQMWFAVWLMLGVYVLILIQLQLRGGRRENQVWEEEGVETAEKVLPVEVGSLPAAGNENAVADLLAESGELSEEQIRQWLDSFLQQQQKS